MTVTVFLLLTAYYLLKTAREPLILLHGGAGVKSYAAAGQAALLLVFVQAYGAVARRVGRMTLLLGVYLGVGPDTLQGNISRYGEGRLDAGALASFPLRAVIPDSLFLTVRALGVACLTLSHRALADEADEAGNAARTPSEMTAGCFLGPTISGAP
jgi:hypothetical protein